MSSSRAKGLTIDEMILLKLMYKIVCKVTVAIQVVQNTVQKLSFVGMTMNISVP